MADAHKCNACGEVYAKTDTQDTCPKCGNRHSQPHDQNAEPEQNVAEYSPEQIVELEDENETLRGQVADLQAAKDDLEEQNAKLRSELEEAQAAAVAATKEPGDESKPPIGPTGPLPADLGPAPAAAEGTGEGAAPAATDSGEAPKPNP